MYQRKDAWEPTLPVPPGKEKEKMDKGEGNTISGAGMRKTKSDVVESGSDEDWEGMIPSTDAREG